MSSLSRGVKHSIASTGAGLAVGLAAYFGLQASPGAGVAVASIASMAFATATALFKINEFERSMEDDDCGEAPVPFLDVPRYQEQVVMTQFPAALALFQCVCRW